MADKSDAARIERNIYERDDGTWGWRILVNGKKIAVDGNQGYENESECRSIADRLLAGYYDTDKVKRTISRKKKE